MVEEMEDTPLLENICLNVMDDTNIWQIVLLGKTGTGKSSLANTITRGLAGFNVSHSARSETKECQTTTQTVDRRQLRLIDIPGLFDTDQDNKKVNFKELKFLIECAPGVHAYLILLKVERFTKQEKEVIKSIFKQLTKEALKYTTVVFTHGDQLPDEITIESWVNSNESVKAVVEKCGGGCLVFDNKYWKNTQHSYRNNQFQTERLIQTIEKTLRQNGGKYTNKNLERIEEQIQKVQAKDPNISRDQAKEIVLKAIWPKIKPLVIGGAIAILVGAVLIPVSIVCFPLEIALGVGIAAGAVATAGGAAGVAAGVKAKGAAGSAAGSAAGGAAGVAAGVKAKGEAGSAAGGAAGVAAGAEVGGEEEVAAISGAISRLVEGVSEKKKENN